jgi:hypothetical protein
MVSVVVSAPVIVPPPPAALVPADSSPAASESVIVAVARTLVSVMLIPAMPETLPGCTVSEFGALMVNRGDPDRRSRDDAGQPQ